MCIVSSLAPPLAAQVNGVIREAGVRVLPTSFSFSSFAHERRSTAVSLDSAPAKAVAPASIFNSYLVCESISPESCSRALTQRHQLPCPPVLSIEPPSVRAACLAWGWVGTWL